MVLQRGLYGIEKNGKYIDLAPDGTIVSLGNNNSN